MSSEPVTVAHLLKMGDDQLQKHGIEAARWEAETLLAHVMGWNRAQLYLNLTSELDDSESQYFVKLLEKRCQRIPLQYLLGSQDFMGLSFAVDQRVLIPRPETELLVERVLFLLQGRNLPRIADLGTGSGAIAVSLAVFHPTVDILAVDLSPQALQVASSNANKHHVTERIRFVQGDMLQTLQDHVPPGSLDGIVSNPPYIAEADLVGLAPEVRDHEPHLALAGGPDGLAFYRILIEHAADYLKENGFLALEIGFDQGEAVTELLAAAGRYAHISLQQDYAGRDRVVWAVTHTQEGSR